MMIIMISVIIIDFLSAKRTYQYINEYIDRVSEESTFVIVDNSEDRTNFDMLCGFLGKMDACKSNEVCFRYRQHDVLLIQSLGNIGFAKGNNLGAEKAIEMFNPEYILFSNNDIRFTEEFTIKPLMQVLQQEEDVVMVGPKVIGLDGKQQSPNRYVPIGERYIYHNILWPFDSKLPFLHKYVNIMHDEIIDAPTGYVYQILGAFFMVDRKKFEEIGMFDAYTFLYAEEEILSERAAKHGYKVYYISDVTIVHEQGATTGNLNDSIQKEVQITKWLLDSEMYYYRTYRGYSKVMEIFCRAATSFYIWKRKCMTNIKKGKKEK